jgi:YHS domain-containing protein
MKQIGKISFALVIVCTLALAGFAQNAKPATKPAGKTAVKTVKFIGKGDGVTTCPVTGEELANKDIHAAFYGREVYFCCAGCLAKAQKSPAAYILKTEAAQMAAVKNMPVSTGHGHSEATAHAAHGEMAHDQHAEHGEVKFIGKGDGIETCPVTGEPVNKNLKGEALGRTFYVCCEGCLETVKKNPAAYLKPVETAKTETAFLGKGDGLETCPVTGEPVNKNLKGEAMGRTFYVCCEGCLETVKKNPAAYLKPAK